MRQAISVLFVFLATFVFVAGPSVGRADDLVPLRLQLQWVTQAEFAGYYAAADLGFYAEEGLEVTLLDGSVEIVPQQMVIAGAAEFGLGWVPKVLESNERGANLVNIAQISQRSATRQVSFADAGIESVEDLRGMRVGTWGFGNEHELFAAMRAVGINPDNPDHVTIVQQPFDVSLLLNGELDAVQTVVYNEYAQVLEAVNPDTGELYQPEDLNVIDFNEVGTAMLQDHVFVSAEWLAEAGNSDLAIAFLKASFRGWIYCRDNPGECVELVLQRGPTLGESHQRWQLNEVNKLIWPSPNGIGIMDEELWAQTVAVAIEGQIISTEPSMVAYRSDLAQAALDSLLSEGYDVTGESWEPLVVELRPGGE
ncbi:MAG: ABC transporter substrate-binding protein [Chloroflexi bacterium]|nr:ABC transporter substrate-binding protein [Chloroflexota bacterium]